MQAMSDFRSAVCLTALVISAPTLAAKAPEVELPEGRIILLPQCPGDVVPTSKEARIAPIIAAILTPLLTGAIDHGLKAVGDKLKAEAQEAQVDVVSTGDHLYALHHEKEGKLALRLKSRCLIVATKGTKKTGRKLQDLLREYRVATYTLESATNQLILAGWSKQGANSVTAANALAEELRKAGYKDGANPGLIVVFDVDLSSPQTDARLITRYVVLDHSIREHIVDSKARDVTLEITQAGSSATGPFGTSVIKFDALTINAPRWRDASSQLPSGQWFALPALPEATRSDFSALEEAMAHKSPLKARLPNLPVQPQSNWARLPSPQIASPRSQHYSKIGLERMPRL